MPKVTYFWDLWPYPRYTYLGYYTGMRNTPTTHELPVEEIDPLSAMEVALQILAYADEYRELEPLSFTLTMSRDGICGVTVTLI